MKDTANMESDVLIGRTRILLLTACFSVSGVAGLLMLGLLWNVITELHGVFGEYVRIAGLVLGFTAAGQLFYNEHLLSPIRSFIDNEKSDNAESGLPPRRTAQLVFALWLAIWTAVYIIIRVASSGSVGILSFVVQTVLTGGVLSGLAYYALGKSKAEGSNLEKVRMAFLELPFKSALFSLFMWIFAGFFIGYFYHIIGMKTSNALYFFMLAINAGALAFPLQYFIFKHVADPLRKRLLKEEHSGSEKDFRFPIRYKLLVSMAVLVLFGVGFSGVLNYSQTEAMLKSQAGRLLQLSLHRNLEKADPGEKDFALRKFADDYEAFPFIISPDGLRTVYSLDPKHAELVEAIGSGDQSRAESLMDRNLVVSTKADDAVYGVILPTDKYLPALDSMRNKALFFGLITVLIAAGMALLAAHDISRPIELMRVESNRMYSESDFRWQAAFFTDDEIADLGMGFERMSLEISGQVVKVNKLLDNMSYTVHHLGASASELELISQNQAAGSAEQAAAIQETLTTAGEIAATARQIAENALTVDNVAAETSEACELSNKLVSETIGGIEEVRERVNEVAHGTIDLARISLKIGGIVDIIEEINEQINLISVNASIEASGAGEEGKRFNVLAREMRRLAEGTLDATEEIKSLIDLIRKSTTQTVMMAEESTKVVDSWADKVHRIGESFSNISMLVDLASRATGEISMSTKQQTTACEQMAQVIAEVKEVADQVVMSARETEKSMSDLSELTTNLKGLVQDNVSRGEAI